MLYGITGTDDQIVTVALSQIGTMGGDPYWSWYGFNSRVEWCACFVSWCANECGYIDAGVIPKYAGCVNGVQWFKDRGQWLDNSAEPTPGMIIFFDWASGGQDGLSDHTGIVQKVENAGFTRSRETLGILFVRTAIRLDIMRYLATVRLPIDRKVKNEPLA